MTSDRQLWQRSARPLVLHGWPQNDSSIFWDLTTGCRTDATVDQLAAGSHLKAIVHVAVRKEGNGAHPAESYCAQLWSVDPDATATTSAVAAAFSKQVC